MYISVRFTNKKIVIDRWTLVRLDFFIRGVHFYNERSLLVFLRVKWTLFHRSVWYSFVKVFCEKIKRVRKLKQFIPLYREKELYTVFYDVQERRLVKLPHRKKTYIVYVVLFLSVLHGTPYVTRFYDHLPYSLLKFIVLFVIIGITCFATFMTYYRYYLWDEISPVFAHVNNLEKIVLKGREQLRFDSVICFFCMIVTFVLGFIFLITQDVVWFVLTNLFLAPSLIYLLMRPIRRMKLLRDYEWFE